MGKTTMDEGRNPRRREIAFQHPKQPLRTSPKHLRPTHHLNLVVLRHRCRKLNSTLRCSASSFSEKHHTNSPNSDDVVELPLFTLPLVLFLGAILPLQIFEFRYRIMMHTLFQTDLRFGVIYTDVVSRTAADGCVSKVIKHESLVDGRFFLICDVARGSAIEVETYMKDVIQLCNRLGGKLEKEVGDLRRNLFPTTFSFFVGNIFEGAPREQQALLELEDTAARLKREKETLKNTLNYLTTASAVKDSYFYRDYWKDIGTIESFYDANLALTEEAAVLAMDDSVLDVDQVENLIKFCPTREEIELLKLIDRFCLKQSLATITLLRKFFIASQTLINCSKELAVLTKASKVTVNETPYQKSCFKCIHGKLYCKHHHMQLIKEKENFNQLEDDMRRVQFNRKLRRREI
ncbi:LIM domain-containing protein [Vigna angularis]|uniref:LIM domain-containing protein n=1 Tax=Phaseolus angularis TaxID=3914 RepID=A0A8T0JTT8_PHAAN|nr:LIM domain-containing protein [Vigna angularis]